MYLTEMIKILKKLEEEHGDIPVSFDYFCSGDYESYAKNCEVDTITYHQGQLILNLHEGIYHEEVKSLPVSFDYEEVKSLKKRDPYWIITIDNYDIGSIYFSEILVKSLHELLNVGLAELIEKYFTDKRVMELSPNQYKNMESDFTILLTGGSMGYAKLVK